MAGPVVIDVEQLLAGEGMASHDRVLAVGELRHVERQLDPAAARQARRAVGQANFALVVLRSDVVAEDRRLHRSPGELRQVACGGRSVLVGATIAK